MANPTFIICGVTGDLTRRKLIPAFYHLLQKNKFEKCAFIGISRSKVSPAEIFESSHQFIHDIDADVWDKLSNSFFCISHDFTDHDGYTSVGEKITAIEKKLGLPGNRLFYLATLPELFNDVTHGLASSGIAKRSCKGDGCKEPWHRLVYEKPFGHNLKSARALNKKIAEAFDESQIFRIDHYLGKEHVGNILMLRFANRFLQPLWNKDSVRSVKISMNEAIGIEGRGEFYDKTGALKDIVQNHLLQLLTLITMDAPKKLRGECIRDEKVKILKNIKVEDSTLGQYDGYADEPGVEKGSTTETFAAIKLGVNTPQWKGVPFMLGTGKHLEAKETVINIEFKKPDCLFTEDCPIPSNTLRIFIEPNEGFSMAINAQAPGTQYDITPAEMRFVHNSAAGINTPESYETLLNEVVGGDQSIFVRFDEVEEAWKIIDNVSKGHPKLYKKGTTGPSIDF
ncbi:glucose-6-phosphate dehydrogenase [bacterium]|nr:glucose-6-phosphate dehydrogenase [bacterium]